jgi:hypothetical protein
VGELVGSGNVATGIYRRDAGLQKLVNFYGSIRIQPDAEILQAKTGRSRCPSDGDDQRIELDLDFSAVVLCDQEVHAPALDETLRGVAGQHPQPLLGKALLHQF